MLFAHTISDDSLVKDVLARKHHIEFSVHGIEHWQRVERNGLFLAHREGGIREVISLFALFHDSQRINDFDDPEHGARGAALAIEFYEGGRLAISDAEMEMLIFACTHHTDMTHHEDATIRCCWDGDRLDLTRIGVLPDPTMLNSSSAITIAESMDYSEINAYSDILKKES